MTAEEQSERDMEREVRGWRDRVFEIPVTAAGWLGCRENWLKPGAVNWLIGQVQSKTKLEETK